MTEIAILGNGPSLKQIDFTKLNIDTIGMNSAYRYWEKVNWYPTYYCCLDVVVLTYHINNIIQLIEKQSGRIKKFLFRKHILKTHPNIKKYKNVIFLEDLCETKDKIFFDSPHITTGSFSARFAMFLGYKKIYLFGIDCNYVNIIKESQKVGDILEIKESIKDNPNYFFCEYQKKGDKYNLPNHNKSYICHCRSCKGKTFDGANLHYNSWKILHDDCVNRFKNGYKIYNCSTISKLDMFELKNYNV